MILLISYLRSLITKSLTKRINFNLERSNETLFETYPWGANHLWVYICILQVWVKYIPKPFTAKKKTLKQTISRFVSLTTCVHSTSSIVVAQPPFVVNISTIWSCSSGGKPKKQIFCPSNDFKRCGRVKSTSVAWNDLWSRCSQAICTQDGRITARRKVIAYWYLSPPLALQIKCVIFEFNSRRIEPPIECIKFTRRVYNGEWDIMLFLYVKFTLYAFCAYQFVLFSNASETSDDTLHWVVIDRTVIVC